MILTSTRVGSLAAAALLLGLLVPGASAAPTWLPAKTLSAGNSTVPQVAFAADGEATAVWQYMPGGGVSRVMVSTRPPGGDWSSPVPVSAEGAFAERPALAVDPGGNTTVVWRVLVGNDLIQATHRDRGGAWSEPVQLSDHAASEAHAAVDAAGNVTALFTYVDLTGPSRRVRAVTWTPAGGWGEPKDLSTNGQNADYPGLAADPGGRVTAVWARFDGADEVVQSSTRAAGSGWELAEDLTPDGVSGFGPALAVRGDEAVAVWTQYNAGSYFVNASRRGAAGWGDPKPLTAVDTSSIGLAVTMDAAGNALATWSLQSGTDYIVQGAVGAPDGTWQATGDLSDTPGQATVSAVVIDGSGAATVVWSRYNGTHYVVQATRKPPGGSWSEPLDLSDLTADAQALDLALDGDGNAVAVWEHRAADAPGVPFVQYAALDAASPKVTLTAPATAVARKGKVFGATASDAWSSVATYAWNFGDGKTGSGASVNHAFAKSGKYVVTVTVTDAVGNATTRQATVTVRARPVVKVLKLASGTIHTGGRTKLTVKLNTKAKLKLVFKGKATGTKAVLKKKLPKGTSKLTITTSVGSKRLRPDTYVLTATATDKTGTSKPKKITLKVLG